MKKEIGTFMGRPASILEIDGEVLNIVNCYGCPRCAAGERSFYAENGFTTRVEIDHTQEKSACLYAGTKPTRAKAAPHAGHGVTIESPEREFVI